MGRSSKITWKFIRNTIKLFSSTIYTINCSFLQLPKIAVACLTKFSPSRKSSLFGPGHDPVPTAPPFSDRRRCLAINRRIGIKERIKNFAVAANKLAVCWSFRSFLPAAEFFAFSPIFQLYLFAVSSRLCHFFFRNNNTPCSLHNCYPYHQPASLSPIWNWEERRQTTTRQGKVSSRGRRRRSQSGKVAYWVSECKEWTVISCCCCCCWMSNTVFISCNLCNCKSAELSKSSSASLAVYFSFSLSLSPSHLMTINDSFIDILDGPLKPHLK